MPLVERRAVAALSVLLALQLVMLFSLYAGVPPHPPASTPLFGMGPFIAAAMSVALASIVLGPDSGAAGRLLSALAAVLALVSFGPQKYLDPQIGSVWPAVVTGQIAAAVALTPLVRSWRRGAKGAFPAAGRDVR